nr:protein SRG1-like [Ipomoea batatas]GME08321.1 protein SRG1-like [Ipomoea batatas]
MEKTLGGTLQVPCVQELAKQSPEIVPPRYFRDDLDPAAPAQREIPVINMANLLQGDCEELKKLDIACKEWGFFQVSNKPWSEFFIDRENEK